MTTKLLLPIVISLLSLQIKAQDGRTHIQYILGIRDNYAVELSFESKLADGICDCSVGDKKKSNACALYAVKVYKTHYWLDSSRYTKDELLHISQVLVQKKLEQEIKLGERRIVTLGNTSSKEYVQLGAVLPNVLNKEYRFAPSYAHVVGMECKEHRETFKER